MKTISMQELREKVRKLAVKKQQPYYTVSAELGQHIYKDGTVRDKVCYKLYVDGYGFHEGETFEEAFKLLNKAMFPKPVQISEITI